MTKAWVESLFGGVKTLIPGVLLIRVWRQEGGLLGWVMPTGLVHSLWVWGLTLCAFLFLLWLARGTKVTKRMRHYGFACMIGGALGNGVDRLYRGYVVDFIDIRFLPVFNLADLALLIGMILTVWSVLSEKREV